MANLVGLLPQNMRDDLVHNLGGFVNDQHRAARERPIEAIVNSIALATIALTVVYMAEAIVAIPVIMPAIATGLSFGIMSLFGSIIFQAVQFQQIHAVAGPAVNAFRAAAAQHRRQ